MQGELYSPGRRASRRELLLNTTSPPSCHMAACVEPRELNTAGGERMGRRGELLDIKREQVLNLNHQISRPYLWRTTEGRRGPVGFNVLLAEAEIRKDDVSLRVQQDVLRLQVSVDDVEGVEVAECAGDLC